MKTPLHTLAAWLCTLAAALACGTAQAAVPQTQIDWLTDFYNSTQGPGWTNHANWLSGDPCDNNWHNVTCNAGKTTVTGLHLNTHNLQGTLPGNWASGLPDLEQADLRDNHLSGSLPNLSGHPTLNAVFVGDNAFTGPLPPMTNLPELQFFYADHNQLTGSIPDLSGLPKLWFFSVSSNKLNGTISPVLPSTLLAFRVEGNALTGPAPNLPAPNNLVLGNSALCPNHLSPAPSPGWDTATAVAPWYDSCTPPPGAAAIPTLGEWALALLALLVGTAAFFLKIKSL